MFRTPTKRARRAMRFTWHDAAMPLAAPASPRHVAKTTSYAASPAPVAQDDGTLDDEARTVTLTLPPNWSELDAASVRDDDNPRNIRPTLDPNSVTRGGTAGPGLYGQEMLLNLPMDGVESVYRCRTDPDGFHVYRRNTNRPDRSELVKSFPVSKDSQYHFSETATNFQVFRVQRRKPLDLGSNGSDGAVYGTLKASFAGDKAAKIRSMNAANRKAWSR